MKKKSASCDDMQDSPDHQGKAKTRQTHRAAPPDRRIVTQELKLEKAAQTTNDVQHRSQDQQHQNKLIHGFSPPVASSLGPAAYRSVRLERVGALTYLRRKANSSRSTVTGSTASADERSNTFARWPSPSSWRRIS